MATTQDPNLPIQTLLPLRCLAITLQATGRSKPSVFHHASLIAYLRHLAGSPGNFDHYIRIDAPETGRLDYQRGDFYRFKLVVLAGGDEILDTLIRQLQKLPHSAPFKDAHLAFRDNWKLQDIQDIFTFRSIKKLDHISVYTEQQLNEEILAWDGNTRINWQWISPARLLKNKQQREKQDNSDPFIRDNDEIDGKLLLSRIYTSLADLLRRRGEKTPKLPVAEHIIIRQSHLFWLENNYKDEKRKKTQLGGLNGNLQIQLPANLSPAWWKLIHLGQYTGIGQNTTFGLGRYQIRNQLDHCLYQRVLPASSILMLAQQPENLEAAWQHIMAGHDDYLQDESTRAWLEDEDEAPEDHEAPIEKLQNTLQKLLDGKYKVPYLRGYLIPKKNGGVRPLAVPPIYDRIMQRAVSQILTPALEKLMHEQSHGYRRGRSRITASDAIAQAWREGYRWVYESDIKSFFDNVQLDMLRDRLNALYFGDPMVDCIINWMRAPVRFQGQTIERKNGLPQGSPLSPLMANLMLDDFDNDLSSAGFKLIRFADDFIVLCKNPEEAKKAEQAARDSLAEHGFELHPDKSHIKALDEGFKYLGYLFINDMVLDLSGSQKKTGKKAPAAPPNSWLAKLGEQQPQHITRQESLTRLIQQVAHHQPIHIAENDNDGILLTVTGTHSVLSTLNQQVQIHRKEKPIYRQPWKSLQAIILFGNHQITTQAMHAALRANVPVHLASSNGRYQGVISHNRNSQHQRLWLQQAAILGDQQKALYLAKEIVASRLRFIKEHLRQRKQNAKIPQIETALKKIHHVTKLEQLRGYEGNATREYYQRLSASLPPEFRFDKRTRRPPKDPFNVLLSLGYTSLYALTESHIFAAGLLPWQGFYHQPRGRHAVLASDLMEPFRYLVERTAASLVNNHEIKAEDFSTSATGACHIQNQARRKYLALLIQRFENKIKARGETEAISWLQHLKQQNQSLKRFIQHGEAFKPFRTR